MNAHSMSQPNASADEEEMALVAEEKAGVLTSHQATQLDVCRCPKCEAPMTARCGAKGPYFHCLCGSPFLVQNGRGGYFAHDIKEQPKANRDKTGVKQPNQEPFMMIDEPAKDLFGRSSPGPPVP